MNRPDNISVYGELDLKLGIKSSLPHAKATIALAILLWESAGRPAELVYSKQTGDAITLTDDLEIQVREFLQEMFGDEINATTLIHETICTNQLFKSQMEALIVAFELIWKLAKVNFVEEKKPASAERTGGTRYPKKLAYSSNMDILHSLISKDIKGYTRILLAWMGETSVNIEENCEKPLLTLLTALSESAVFKLVDGDKDVIFNQNSIYIKALETDDTVDINGDKEAKGSLRILKSLLSDSLNPYLTYNNGAVSIRASEEETISNYQKRVDTFLRLSATKVIGLDDEQDDEDNCDNTEEEPSMIERTPRVYKIHPMNLILYGAPGTGKTYATAEYALAIVEHRDVSYAQKNREQRSQLMEQYNKLIKEGRIVFTTFHQSYGYEDFIQGLRPDTESEKMSFKTVDGVFKRIADRAMADKENDYVIIIDEINRANISKVFGELITLIEEDKRWGELNAISITLPSGESFAVPNNLYIVGTMNSADKSISLIDTALRRRFEFVEVTPDYTVVEDETLRAILEKLNKGLADELDSTDLLIGHAYFIGKTMNNLCEIMNRSIIPLLYEYFYDNAKKVKDLVKKAVDGYNYDIQDGKIGRIKLVKKD